MFKLLKKIYEYFVNKNEIKNYVYYINGNDTLPPPLSKEEEDELFKRYEKGDQDARNKLIIHNLRLVVYVAKRYEVNVPIINTVYDVLYNNLEPKQALKNLMTREAKSE